MDTGGSLASLERLVRCICDLHDAIDQRFGDLAMAARLRGHGPRRVQETRDEVAALPGARRHLVQPAPQQDSLRQADGDDGALADGEVKAVRLGGLAQQHALQFLHRALLQHAWGGDGPALDVAFVAEEQGHADGLRGVRGVQRRHPVDDLDIPEWPEAARELLRGGLFQRHHARAGEEDAGGVGEDADGEQDSRGGGALLQRRRQVVGDPGGRRGRRRVRLRRRLGDVVQRRRLAADLEREDPDAVRRLDGRHVAGRLGARVDARQVAEAAGGEHMVPPRARLAVDIDVFCQDEEELLVPIHLQPSSRRLELGRAILVLATRRALPEEDGAAAPQ
mmetsp:Transcript_46716/g.135991  ORF Transcript_46716/g.135991 Transcript_46716/m.135991 type:complete len:336 (-) Transcript_46716:273-1280(-)